MQSSDEPDPTRLRVYVSIDEDPPVCLSSENSISLPGQENFVIADVLRRLAYDIEVENGLPRVDNDSFAHAVTPTTGMGRGRSGRLANLFGQPMPTFGLPFGGRPTCGATGAAPPLFLTMRHLAIQDCRCHAVHYDNNYFMLNSEDSCRG